MRRGTATVAGNAPQRGGTTEAAAIMNNVRKVNEQRIIKQIGKRDKTVAQTIEEEMFIFDNLIEMDDKNLGALLRTIENDVLVVALKRSEEHTSELQSLMRISYAVFCLKKKKKK